MFKHKLAALLLALSAVAGATAGAAAYLDSRAQASISVQAGDCQGGEHDWSCP
ncbi:hypothetical protein [Nonomuraea sp. NPDC002799]